MSLYIIFFNKVIISLSGIQCNICFKQWLSITKSEGFTRKKRMMLVFVVHHVYWLAYRNEAKWLGHHSHTYNYLESLKFQRFKSICISPLLPYCHVGMITAPQSTVPHLFHGVHGLLLLFQNGEDKPFCVKESLREFTFVSSVWFSIKTCWRRQTFNGPYTWSGPHAFSNFTN